MTSGMVKTCKESQLLATGYSLAGAGTVGIGQNIVDVERKCASEGHSHPGQSGKESGCMTYISNCRPTKY